MHYPFQIIYIWGCKQVIVVYQLDNMFEWFFVK